MKTTIKKIKKDIRSIEEKELKSFLESIIKMIKKDYGFGKLETNIKIIDDKTKAYGYYSNKKIYINLNRIKDYKTLIDVIFEEIAHYRYYRHCISLFKLIDKFYKKYGKVLEVKSRNHTKRLLKKLEDTGFVSF